MTPWLFSNRKSVENDLKLIDVIEIFRVSPVFGQCFYFPANKEIDATKLYQLKYPRTIQDLCCEIP